MNREILTQHLPDLLSAALYKCRNQTEAEDLVQETMLSALLAMSRNTEIENLKAYLFRVLNNKHNEMLRKKYGRSIVCIDSIAELYSEDTALDDIVRSEEAETIRREIAYLVKIYRDVIIGYYFYRKSVSQIASELKISEGTVKSRLNTGRQQIKKGVESMENYSKQSYEPMNMWISNTGAMGFYDEPFSLAENMVAKNILIFAYEKPVTIVELSKGLGIPAAYIEPEVERLLRGELMGRMGDGKVYTDFIIFSLEGGENNLDVQLNFAEKNTDNIWSEICKALINLDAELCIDQSQYVKNKLHMYAAIKILQGAGGESGQGLWKNIPYSDYPERPNGGKWYAMGTMFPSNYDFSKNNHAKYNVDGTNNIEINGYYGSKSAIVSQFGMDLGQTWHGYKHVNQYTDEQKYAQLLYSIAKHIPPEESMLDADMYENLPVLESLGIVKFTENGTEIDIPVLSREEMNRFWKITEPAVDNIVSKFGGEIREFIRSRKYEIPSHVKSFLPMHQYMGSFNSIPMAIIYNAIANDLFDIDKSKPCPAMLIIEDK